MKRITAACIVIVFLLLTGCAGLSDKEQRTLTGGLIGAGAGAGIAAIAGGKAGVGALVGAGAGALTGYIIGAQKEKGQ